MSFRAYAEYKDAGVPWLGPLPKHWAVERITILYREAVEAGTEDLPILSVSIHTGVSDEESKPSDSDRKVTRSDDRTKYKRVQPNDLVYNMMRAWQGGFGAVQVLGMVSPAYVVARPRGNVPSKFVELLLRTPGAIEEMRRRSRGVTDFRLRLYWDEFKDIQIALPPADERLGIVAFVERESAKIDALVAEQERLIALLKEKRQAVISHAVTKGLNPHAPMKDSGIEWLGEIPAHWQVSRLKFSTEFITSGSRGWGDYYADEGPLFIRITNLTRDSIHLNLADEQRVAIPENAEGSRALLKPGDLLFSITAYLGSVGIVPNEIEEAYISQHVALCRLCTDAPVAEWLGYTALSVVGRTHFDIRGYGGTKVQLSLADVAEMPTLIPPEVEQSAILADLEMRLEAFRNLEAEAQAAITLLQERRAALISAAVTGKIDVRGQVAPEDIDRAEDLCVELSDQADSCDRLERSIQ